MKTREEIREYHRQWYSKNKQKRLKTIREYRERNPELIKERAAEYWKKNKETMHAKDREWRKKHPEKIKMYNQKDRTKRRFSAKQVAITYIVVTMQTDLVTTRIFDMFKDTYSNEQYLKIVENVNKILEKLRKQQKLSL